MFLLYFYQMKILVGMDERETTLLYQFILVNRGHQVKITETGGKCINTYRKNLQVVRPKDFKNSFVSSYDVVILDQVLPDINGLQIAKRILGVNPYQRIILTSGSIQEAIIPAMKELRMPIQILSKALLSQLLISAVEDTEIYDELKKFKADYGKYIKYNEIHKNVP
jgi:CheY-like chemotaxis protein